MIDCNTSPIITTLFEATGSKLAPSMVMMVLRGPLAGVMLAMVTAGITVKSFVLVPTLLFTETDNLPLVALLGTWTCSEVVLAETTIAVAPLNFTRLAEAFELKLAPLIVTVLPGCPLIGVKLAMLGVGLVIVNDAEVVALCLLVFATVMGPSVTPSGTVNVMELSVHVLGGRITPLSWILPMPWLAPKLVPDTVIVVP